VSTGEGVHGNIVFTSDFAEAAWHPNYEVDGKALIYIMKYRKGRWESPSEFFPKDGHNYSEPFYSYDGKKLYYLSGNTEASGHAEKERIFCVERRGEGWSAPKLLSSELDAIPTHWQFSLDKDENLYFGGKSPDKQGEIYFSQYRDGRYFTPVRLPETVNTGAPEFSPFISPDNSYLVFARMLVQENAPPQTNLFVSFRDNNNRWTEAQNLTAKIKMPVQSPVVIMGAPRITPDGKYLFFCYFDGKGHMVYWGSARIIEDLRPKELK
jgi:Tol biopolymer transport system component